MDLQNIHLRKGHRMDEATWLELRRSGLGGSDAGAVVGVNPYRTALHVYEDKLRLALPQAMNLPMLLGRLMEPVVAALYEAQEGATLTKPGFQRHPDHRWVLGTPDRVITGQARGVELKTTVSHNARQWGKGGDEIPPHYLMQCAHYMLLTDVDEWDIAVLIGGSDFRVYHLERNQRLERALFEKGYEFWHKHVLKHVPPVLSPDEVAKLDLDARYPRDKDARLLTAGEDLFPWLDTLARLVPEHKQRDKEIEKAKIILKAAIGDHAGLRGPWGSVTWTASEESSKPDWERLARFLGATPELIKAFTERKAGSRRFLTQFNGRDVISNGSET